MKKDKKYKGIVVFTCITEGDIFDHFIDKLKSLQNNWFTVSIELIDAPVSVDEFKQRVYDYYNDNYICLVYVRDSFLSCKLDFLLMRLAKMLMIEIFSESQQTVYHYMDTFKILYDDELVVYNAEKDIDGYVLYTRKNLGIDHIFIGIVSDNKEFVMNLFDNACARAKKELQVSSPTFIRKKCHVPFSYCYFTGLLKIWVVPDKIESVESPKPIFDDDPKVAFVNEVLSIRYDEGHIITYHYIKPSTIIDFSKIDLYDELYVDLNSHYKTLILPKNKDMHVNNNVHPFTSLDLPFNYTLLKNSNGNAESESIKNKCDEFSNQLLNQMRNTLNYFYDRLLYKDNKGKRLDKNGFSFDNELLNMECPVLKDIFIQTKK